MLVKQWWTIPMTMFLGGINHKKWLVYDIAIPTWYLMPTVTLWIFNSLLLKITIEIVDIPIQDSDFPVCYVSHYQRVNPIQPPFNHHLTTIFLWFSYGFPPGAGALRLLPPPRPPLPASRSPQKRLRKMWRCCHLPAYGCYPLVMSI